MKVSLRVVALVPGGIAIAAHVDQEHIEQRSIGDLTIDPAGLLRDRPDRHEFMEGTAGARDDPRRAVVAVTARVVGAERRPVVGHLMIVPLREHRYLRVERAHVFVEQIVFVIAAKLGERVCDGGFFLGDDVAPDSAVRQFQFGRHGTIGIDVIAGVDEKIRAVVEHGAIGPHAAAGRVDTPALACGIARPDKG